jgi:GTP-sensing pleiotropic transcriptional regulator CodY
MKNTVEQLCDIYYKYEYWHNNKMPYPEAVNYHRQMLLQGNIKIVEDLGVVLGYYQVYLINKEQLNRLVLHKNFDERKEDILNGNIAYVANLWIDKSFRKGYVFREIRAKFLEQTKHCSMICGEEQPRKGRLRIFSNKRSRKWEAKNLAEQQL